MAGGRPLRITWQDDIATLEEAYRRERDYQLRPRLHALWLVRQGHGLREAAALVGVDETSVQRWVHWYRRDGLAAGRGHRRTGPGRVGWLSGEQLEHMAEAAATGQFRTAAEAVDWVAKEYGVRYRRGGMYSLLHRLRWRPKVPRPRNPKASDAEQAAWKKGGFGRR
jgi:transposase